MDEDFDISGDDDDVSFHDVEPLDNPEKPVDQPVVSTEIIIALKRTRGRPPKNQGALVNDNPIIVPKKVNKSVKASIAKIQFSLAFVCFWVILCVL